jgi:hypothetical protein
MGPQVREGHRLEVADLPPQAHHIALKHILARTINLRI